MKKIITGVLAAGFTVTSVLTATSAVAAPAHEAGTTGKPTAKTPSYDPPPIEWQAKCASAGLNSRGIRCGLLTVPLDYANPNGEKIKIAVSEYKHTASVKSQGIMLVNPGGPGGSGLTLSVLKDYVPKGGGAPYDWIGFDPRGVGSSQPSLSCDPDYFPFNRPDYVPVKKADEQFWLKKSKKYANDCAKQGRDLVATGSLLNHLKTTDTVNDMESIRKAFGQKKINYYGFSYGTTIGQTYATLHPDRLRRAVFDGVTNPTRSIYQSNLDQDIAFEKTENIFFTWVARHNDVYGLGTSGKAVRKVWDKMLDESRVKPFDNKIGPDEWTDAFLGAGYYVFGWEETAEAFKQAVAENYGPIEDLYTQANGAPGPGSDNGFAIYLGTQCTDEPWPTSYAKIRRDNYRTYAKAPFETWANAWFNGPCKDWKGKASAAKTVIDGSKAAPVLLIEETFDAATPFDGALAVRKLFPKSVLIEGVNGSTHAGSLNGVSCTDDRIADYLLTGKLDKRLKGNTSDVKCPPVPQPEPAAAAAKNRSLSATGGMPADVRKVITSAGFRP